MRCSSKLSAVQLKVISAKFVQGDIAGVRVSLKTTYSNVALKSRCLFQVTAFNTREKYSGDSSFEPALGMQANPTFIIYFKIYASGNAISWFSAACCLSALDVSVTQRNNCRLPRNLFFLLIFCEVLSVILGGGNFKLFFEVADRYSLSVRTIL